jgi:aspartate dehydrogenase
MEQQPKLAIIGAGAIGSRIAQAVHSAEINFKLTAICDIEEQKAATLKERYAPEAAVATMAEAAALADVVIECAAVAAVPALVTAVRAAHANHGKPADLVVLSIGGLLDVAELEAAGPVIHIPAGALGGLNAVQAMNVAGLESVELTSRKPPAGLGLDVNEETVVFEGSAAEVIRKFPKNVNVAIALSFAGIGPERTRVRLVADPAVDRNTHHVVARGAAGEIEFISRNVPFPENPRTSYLAALSAIAMLRRLSATLQVG